MTDIAIGDTIRHTAVPHGLLNVTVLAVKACEGDGEPGDHPSYLIKDPETDEPDWVCSRDFEKVS